MHARCLGDLPLGKAKRVYLLRFPELESKVE